MVFVSSTVSEALTRPNESAACLVSAAHAATGKLAALLTSTKPAPI